MKKVQRFIGVGDSKPASAPLATSPSNSYLSSAMIASAPAAATSTSYDTSNNRLLPPSSQQTAQPQPSSQQHVYASRQVSPQSSHTLLHSARASPQPYSPSAQQQYFDLPTRAVSPGVGTTPRPVSPLAQPLASPSASPSTSALKPVSSAEVHLVERTDLHKSLKALESLLVNLDEYRDLSARLAKVEKKLAKSASELERTKVVLDTPAQTLQLTSAMFEGFADVSSRHAKHVQKEYEAVNDACAKYFKKVAKEERAHDELVQSLDAKIKKANAAHEKNVKKATTTKALESHDKYIATVQALTNDISRAKNAHALSMAAKSHVSSLLVASTVGGLADVEFKRRCESVRRVGTHVGRLNELLCFASSEFMPALHASQFNEAEQGQAEYLASLAAQLEAQVAAQAHINAKINEDTQTILRAQEMGWRPPSPLAPPTTAYANLGRSSSINSNASRPAAAAAAATADASASLQQPEREATARSRSNSSSRVEPALTNASASLAAPLAAENDATSIHSVATDKTPRPNEGALQPPRQPQPLSGASSASALLDVGLGSARLDRAPTGSTMKSMAAQPQNWEDAAVSFSSSSAVGASRNSSAPSTHDRDRTDESAQGSIVDRLTVPREDSDAVPPSLSTSNSAHGSEDGTTRIPRTPDDSEAVPSIQSKSLQQYREQTTKSTPPTTTTHPGSDLGRSDSVYSSTSQQSVDAGNARKISLWERERERMRQLERDDDPSRTPAAANELSYSRPPSGVYSGSTTSSSYNTGGGWTRSKLSDTGGAGERGGSQLGLGYPVEVYAPAVGSTRLSATGVTRSLSTDTTASERSFVARMKARYQAEKDLEREQRQLNVLEKERAARRATIDPSTPLPSVSAGGARGGGGGGGRVPEIASRYQTTYGQEVNPGRRYHDSLPGGASRISAVSSTSAPGIDEFGGIVRDARHTSTMGGSRAEVAHSDVCGCHQCSARHYGNGTTRVDAGRAQGDPREFNVRRTSMPVAPRGSSIQPPYAKQYHQQQQQTYASSPPRRAQQAYAYRHQQLHPPADRDAAATRNSYDDGPRRVVFAHEPQTIR